MSWRQLEYISGLNRDLRRPCEGQVSGLTFLHFLERKQAQASRPKSISTCIRRVNQVFYQRQYGRDADFQVREEGANYGTSYAHKLFHNISKRCLSLVVTENTHLPRGTSRHSNDNDKPVITGVENSSRMSTLDHLKTCFSQAVKRNNMAMLSSLYAN